MRRKSSVHRMAKEENTVDTTGMVIYSRKDDKVDIDKFVFEDYKIVKHVGRGTFGKVYLVQNQKTGSYFAMKSIRKDVVL
jgi:serine/threonine protein kinase|tara:strand:+ start:75 stop:314 length:240 start_codon:yes stop_codon:yes gene_type:complete